MENESINDELVVAYLRHCIQRVMKRQYIHHDWEHYKNDLVDCVIWCKKINQAIEALDGVPEPIRIQVEHSFWEELNKKSNETKTSETT